jgi:branched-chain amino acid transport system substrate-binding protein
MARVGIADLIAQLHMGKISRRDFVKGATALGLSAGLVGQVLNASPAAAQEGGKATDIGTQGIEHITDTSKGTIKLYSSWPLTGSYDLLGNDAVQAVKLALEDFGNAAGGYALEYEALDDGIAANNGGWEAGKESENANKVVADAAAVVYMGTYNSGAAKISIPIMNAAGMAQISYANTYPGISKAIEGVTEEGEPDIYYPSGKRNYMRVCPADDIQGNAQANFIFNDLGKKKAYILHDQSLYGKGVAAVFQLVYGQLGGEVLGFEGYDPKAPDYQALMASVVDAGPEVVMVGATVDNNAAKLLQDLRSVASADDVVFIGPDGLINDAFVQGSGEAGEGAYLTFAGLTPDKLLEQGGPGADYVTRISEILGHSPDSYAVYAYETAVVVIQAIDRAQSNDRAAVLDAMFTTKDFVSILGGQWSFTETGDTDSSIIGLAQIVDGAIAFQKTVGTV